MYRRLIILTVIITVALCGLTLLGYHAIEIWARGIESTRLGEFAAVAEQIRQDVKRKLDVFMQTEQNRAYTDYQYYYVPENVAPGQRAQQVTLLRSPLAGGLDNSFAWGNFQIESDGRIITPNDDIVQREGATEDNKSLNAKVLLNRKNIGTNLLPVLKGVTPGSFKLNVNMESALTKPLSETQKKEQVVAQNVQKSTLAKDGGLKSRQGKTLPIESLRAQRQKTQVIKQERQTFIDNVAANPDLRQRVVDSRRKQQNERMDLTQSQETGREQTPLTRAEEMAQTIDRYADQQSSEQREQSETVQVRIGGFETIVTGGGSAEESIFAKQVFLLRNVQIEDRHFLQGFQLNEKKLVEEVKESAARLIREGMGFELPQTKNGWVENNNVAYTAVLVFDFGELVLNLMEIDPAWIGRQINQLRHWYFGIISIVLLAVTLALTSLWLSTRAQLKLAQKKDDFISAVSHELRTPLTSIRMYSEILEKNWVKSKKKLAEYYSSMRQESERLSRLIENVLDFSHIQRDRKKYTFSLGDINECIADVVEMMTPYAAQSAFSIKMDLEHPAQTAFDGDAVTQIVVNLLDNAIKYARDAEDKTITVRTRSDEQFILIEVEDHGPGVPHRQRKKIFEEFYRSGAEATRETTGIGLGLALVKKFAQAHNGFVEIITAKPTGAIFRVALPLLVAGRGQT
ncbi:Adaptive-response sensory-kinase SasA [subsurface metagenome]